MPSEITLNTIENRSPFHKRLAENVIKYISCGRLLLKWQQKKVQKCETLSGCMCFFDEGGLKLRINIQDTWRVKMMIILQTNVIVSNFFAQDAPQFQFQFQAPSPLPILLHYRQEWLCFRHVFPNRTRAVYSFAILATTRFLTPGNELDNTQDHLGANSLV